jgi:hypothetical protein
MHCDRCNRWVFGATTCDRCIEADDLDEELTRWEDQMREADLLNEQRYEPDGRFGG